MADRPAHSMVSRPLLLGWILWLLISWTVNFVIDPPQSLPLGESLTPAARGTMVSVVIGLMLVWPAWRLSASPIPANGAQIATDAVCILLLSQIVIVLVGALLARWTLQRFLLIEATTVVWTAAAAVCTWLGWRSARPTARALALAACAAMLGGGWLAMGLGAAAEAAHWSPLHTVWVLATPQMDFDAEAMAWRLLVVAGATATVWFWMLRDRADAMAPRLL